MNLVEVAEHLVSHVAEPEDAVSSPIVFSSDTISFTKFIVVFIVLIDFEGLEIMNVTCIYHYVGNDNTKKQLFSKKFTFSELLVLQS